MQMAVIEFSRTVLGLTDANSSEMNEATKNPVIDLMESQKQIVDMGGTMRLGAWSCTISSPSIANDAYNQNTIAERHRHRYEYNNSYKTQLEAKGMIATGINTDTGLVEIVEIPAHPWFVGVQYHPEYKSTVANPHPLFKAFIEAALKNKSSN